MIGSSGHQTLSKHLKLRRMAEEDWNTSHVELPALDNHISQQNKVYSESSGSEVSCCRTVWYARSTRKTNIRVAKFNCDNVNWFSFLLFVLR